MNESQKLKLGRIKRAKKPDEATLKDTKKLRDSIGELKQSLSDLQVILESSFAKENDGLPEALDKFQTLLGDFIDVRDKGLEVLFNNLVSTISQMEVKSVYKPNISLSPNIKVPQARVTISPNVFDVYRPVDEDTKSSNQYFGYSDVLGNWFILRINLGQDNKSYRFTTGNSDYVRAWGRRTSHNYKRFYEVKFHAI